MSQEPGTQLYRAVIYRALYDALGFTGVSRKSDEHLEAVEDARKWFYDTDTDKEGLEFACNMAQLDYRLVKASSIKLIEAKQSGDYSKIPNFWRDCFARNRAPSFGALQKDVAFYKTLV